MAHSKSGTGLQLVDMMTGPSEVSGEAGVRDGRMDVLLDAGTYRLRTLPDKDAHETVTLEAAAFQDAAPPRALPPPGQTFAAPLTDKQQRSFWLLVPPSGQVRIEAAGRSLASLRLWRAGRELAALEPDAISIEPEPGHPLTRLLLEGVAEPGTYLVTAYGGPALPWTDGASAQPFLLRAGLQDTLAEGWTAGTIGPFGSEAYAVPAYAGRFRLDLPKPSEATLRLGMDTKGLTRTSREPQVVMEAAPGSAALVEITGRAGQPFTLRATEPTGFASVRKPGTYWMSAIASGAGGDEVPPTLQLLRGDGREPAKIVASTVPVLTPGSAWRQRFNLRGPTALLFQNSTGGPVALRSTGQPLATDPGGGPRYDVPANYYVMRLAPKPGAAGAVDVTLGAPGATPPLALPLPPDPVIPLGLQAVGPGQTLTLLSQTAPGSMTGLSARPSPVNLAAGPLMLTQAAGGPKLVVPVTVAPGGTLAAQIMGEGPLAVLDEPASEVGAGARRITIPPADKPRTVVLAWRRTPAPYPPVPAPPAPGATATLRPGTPLPFDLAENEQRGVTLDLTEGGLFRVETGGRLRTEGHLANAFNPALDEGVANGVGQNMLIQRWLRAGRYRVDIKAAGSSGHGQVMVSPAPLLDGATLVPGAAVRASLSAGSGVRFPIHVSQAGRYTLELTGLDAKLTARLDDAEGWPLTKPGELTTLEQKLEAGEYRLIISPAAVAHQVSARLTPILEERRITGHGPHRLPFEAAQSATWLEPPGRADPRTPDRWTFVLAGPAHATLDVSGGMVAELRPDGASAEARPVARVTKSWTGTLEAGQYRVDATSLGRNDRLEYTVALHTDELQPGPSRTVTLPSSTPFSLAAPGVVDLTTFGHTPVKAVLRRADGTEIDRVGAREDGWDLALSRLLPPGAYRLDLAAASAPDGVATPRDPGVAALETGQTDEAQADDTKADDAKPDQEGQDTQSAPDAPAARSAQAGASDDDAKPTVELSLALPASLPPAPAPATAGSLTGEGVHVLTLQQPEPGALLIAQAAAEASYVLSLERQNGEGWRVVAQDQGRAPLVAALADGDARAWRLQAWAVDGGPAPARLAARAVMAEPQGELVTLAALDGFPQPIAAARLKLDGLTVRTLDRGSLLAVSLPGAAAALAEGQVAPQTDTLWLLSRTPGPVTLAPLLGSMRAVTLAPGATATLIASQTPRGVPVWLAESGLGQPAFATGAIASGSALAQGEQVAVHNALEGGAGEGGALRVQTTLLDLAPLPERPLEPGFTATLPPRSALPVRLPGPGEVTASLAAGTGVLGGAAIWTGAGPVTRTVFAESPLLLVNSGSGPAPVTLAWTSVLAGTLAANTIVKRFYGAAGSFERRTAPGQIVVAGDASLTWLGEDGRVLRGRSVDAAVPGRVVVTHGPGAVILSLAHPGVSPWPGISPQTVSLPGTIPMRGPTMALTLTLDAPSLLHATTTAPVLLGLGGPPELFAAGAELHRALPPGPATLTVNSPHDGDLSGTLTLSAEPIRPAREGLGEAVVVAPGGSAAFGFILREAATAGIGIRAEPDRAEVRLMDGGGAVLGVGVAQLRTLPPGRYVLEARIPADAPATTLRPAIVGITPQHHGPPPDVAQTYLELAGMKPQEPSR